MKMTTRNKNEHMHTHTNSEQSTPEKKYTELIAIYTSDKKWKETHRLKWVLMLIHTHQTTNKLSVSSLTRSLALNGFSYLILSSASSFFFGKMKTDSSYSYGHSLAWWRVTKNISERTSAHSWHHTKQTAHFPHPFNIFFFGSKFVYVHLSLPKRRETSLTANIFKHQQWPQLMLFNACHRNFFLPLLLATF